MAGVTQRSQFRAAPRETLIDWMFLVAILALSIAAIAVWRGAEIPMSPVLTADDGGVVYPPPPPCPIRRFCK